MNKSGIFLETVLNKTFVSLFQGKQVIETKYSLLDFKSDNTYVYDISIVLKKHSLSITSIDELIVVNGPGYFTGIRSGIIISKAFFYASGLKVAIIDSFTFLRRCTKWDSDCGILISTSKKGCYLGYFKGFNKEKEVLISLDDIPKVKEEVKLFTESSCLSSTYLIDSIEPQPVLDFDYEFAKTIDEIKPFYMRSEESLFKKSAR